MLKDGNERFTTGNTLHYDRESVIRRTAPQQYPVASILSCIDSRVPAEIVFDQYIGDILSVRVAGNVVGDDILGSLEFGSASAGARLVVVLGHTNCGAVSGACDDVRLGNLTGLLGKIRPAVEAAVTTGERTSANRAFVDDVAHLNVQESIKEIRRRSVVLRELEQAGDIRIVGAMYDLSTGRVIWQE